MQLCIYATAVRILTKGYLPISLITPLKLKEILNTVRMTVRKTNPDYDIVIKRLHLYYDMKLVTFCIDKESLSVCHDVNSKLVMYFTVNMAIVNYLDQIDNLTETL